MHLLRHDAATYFTPQTETLFRVPMLPGKPGILSFTFPGLENAWNLLKN